MRFFYKFTSMYNTSILSSITESSQSLIGLVGMDQTSDPEYDTLPNSVLESRSGYYLQRQHPLLTVKNLDQCYDNADHFFYPEFDNGSPGTLYSLGDKVSYLGSNYEYINPTPSVGNLPTDPVYWKVHTPFTQFLLRKQQQAISEALDDCFDEKKTRSIVKTIFSETSLFSGPGRVSNKVINRGSFVGLRIEVADSRGLLALISRIGVQLSMAVDFDIYVFHSSQVNAIATIPVSFTTPNNFQWVDAATELRYFSEDHDSGGQFFVGYFQDDISSAQALIKEYDWSRRPCVSGCDPYNASLYDTWSPYVSITPFSVASGHLNGDNLPNLDYASFDYSNNYGLNLNFTVRCDLTGFIKENEQLLRRPIALKWALLMINEIAYNVRSTKISERTKTLALMEMDAKKADSLVNKYDQAIKALSFDFSNLDDSCLNCNNKYGISWGGM